MVLRANHQIGTGHLMRLRSLIPYLKEKARVCLYVYAFEERLRPLCTDYDAVYTFAHKEDILEHLLSLPLPPQAHVDEATAVSAPEVKYLPEVLVIDDYAIDKSFESQLYPRCKLFVVDDLFDRTHQCHMLLDQTLKTHEAEYRALCNPECQLLLGAPYSLTLECFYPQHYNPNYKSHCSCAAHTLPLSSRLLTLTTGYTPAKSNTATSQASMSSVAQAHARLPRVFVNFGGADPVGACLKVARSVVGGRLYERFAFTMLSGAANPDYEAISELTKSIEPEWQHNFILIRHCSDVADLFVRHDIALGAYGGMFRERIAAGLPTIGVIIADNQKGADDIVEHYELGLNLKLSELEEPDTLERALETLYKQRTRFTQNCLKVYDGHGLERIVKAIFSLLG